MSRTMTHAWPTGAAIVGTVALAALLLAGCAPLEPGGSPDDPVSSDDSPGSTPGSTPSSTPSPIEAPPAEPVTADLTIVVDPTGEGAAQTFTLTCSPDGGDHPDPAAACAALAQAGVEAFAPTPRGVACTEQWGGPQVATVQGTVDGEQISARFDRTDGCQISRWDRLAPVFGPDAGLR